MDAGPKLILKNWLVANPGLDDNTVLATLNALNVPTYWAWKTILYKHDYQDNPSIDINGVATAFVWGGTNGGYINRSQGERDCYREIFNSTLNVNPSLGNVRTAFEDMFSGSGSGAQMNRRHFWGISQRVVTVFEQLCCIQTLGGPAQTGNRGSKTNPDTFTYQGTLVTQDIVDAIAS